MKRIKVFSLFAPLLITGSIYADAKFIPPDVYMPICGTDEYPCTIYIRNATTDVMKVINPSHVEVTILPGTSAMVQQKPEDPGSDNCDYTYTQKHSYTVTGQLLSSSSGKVDATFTQFYQVACGKHKTYYNGYPYYEYWVGYLEPLSPPTCTSGCDTGQYSTSYELGSNIKFDDNGRAYYDTLRFDIMDGAKKK